jgi:hypothetical protein
MSHAGQLDVAGINRFAGYFFDAIDSMRIGPRDFISVLRLHGVRQKSAGHGEIFTVAVGQRYLRIFGLSFSGKYLSQNGQ